MFLAAADRKPAGVYVELTIWATFWDNKDKYGPHCKVQQKKHLSCDGLLD